MSPSTKQQNMLETFACGVIPYCGLKNALKYFK